MTEGKRIIRISVRHLVEFLLRRGSIEPGAAGPAGETAMREGARIHRKLQKEAGDGYRAEVPLRMDIPLFSGSGGKADLLPDPDRIPSYINLHGGSDRMGEADPLPDLDKGSSYVNLHGDCNKKRETDALPDQDAVLRLEGRADGIFFMSEGSEKEAVGPRACGPGAADDGPFPPASGAQEQASVEDRGIWTIDEIKTVYGHLSAVEAPEEVHLAQARCYAYMYAEREDLDRIRIRMTYCSQVTEKVRCFYEELQREELGKWFGDLVRAYAPWAALQVFFDRQRMETIRHMTFPFPYREGQFALAAGVYRTIVHRKKLFLQAPTGTGKTMAVLFPSLKAIGEGKADRIFYLTAKAVTGRAAVDALTILCGQGLRVRSLVLASKERVCACCRQEAGAEESSAAAEAAGRFAENSAAAGKTGGYAGGRGRAGEAGSSAAGGAAAGESGSSIGESSAGRRVECRPSRCPRADGHYDRINAALRDLLEKAFSGLPMTTERVADCARRHCVCPYELSLDAADFADVVICDYNYVYHPAARLTRFFGEGAEKGTLLLIDEAHNLLERGRGMYSADLSEGDVRLFRRSIRDVRPRLWKSMKGLTRVLRNMAKEQKAAEKEEGRETSAGRTGDGYTAGEGRKRAAGKSGGRPGETKVYGQGAGEELLPPARRKDLLDALQETRSAIRWILEQEGRSSTLYGTEAGDLSGLLEFYFQLTHFQNMLESLDSCYIVYATSPGFVLHLFCADPSVHLQACMEKTAAAVFFSATFLPIQYYKGLLGGTAEDFEMYARSSFSPTQQKVVLVDDVTSRYRARNEENYRSIALSIRGITVCRSGNYMVFFPSYAFLENVRAAFERLLCEADGSGKAGQTPGAVCGDPSGGIFGNSAEDLSGVVAEDPPGGVLGNVAEDLSEVVSEDPPGAAFGDVAESLSGEVSGDPSGEFSVRKIELLVQRPKMEDGERAAFLEAFQETRPGRSLVGFCVLGGMFGEGIDLQGDRLIGSLVVGTGIPPVEPQREMLRAYFSAQGKNGYDYAYRYPGMNKVLQAAGRVIRTAQDRGVVLLMDDRFRDPSNRALFPLEWGTPVPAGSREAAEIVRRFWGSAEEHVSGGPVSAGGSVSPDGSGSPGGSVSPDGSVSPGEPESSGRPGSPGGPGLQSHCCDE